MEDPNGSVVHHRLILGILILGLGGFLALQALGVVDFHFHMREYWPLILIFVGIANLLSPRRRKTGGIILVALGSWFLARNLTDVDLDRFFFPFLLLVVGAALVVGAFGGGGRRQLAAGTPADGGAVLHPFAMLGGTKTRSDSQAYQGGSATALLGSCILDLRQAAIPDGQEALVDTFAFWGGIVILVPESWSVALHGLPLLGSFHDATQPPAGGPTRRLVVRGTAIMGSVEVRNRPEREDRV
jgi:predicted membrane protein